MNDECEGIALWSQAHCPGCTATQVPRKPLLQPSVWKKCPECQGEYTHPCPGPKKRESTDAVEANIKSIIDKRGISNTELEVALRWLVDLARKQAVADYTPARARREEQ